MSKQNRRAANHRLTGGDPPGVAFIAEPHARAIDANGWRISCVDEPTLPIEPGVGCALLILEVLAYGPRQASCSQYSIFGLSSRFA
jgi:hypothetical protein